MNPSREYLLVLATLAAGAVACIVLAGAGWASADLATALDTSHVSIAGRELVPVAAAAGWLGLAAVVAVHASARAGRVVIGALLALVGLVVAGWSSWRALDLQGAAEAAAATGDAVAMVTSTAPAAAIGTALGGALIATAGALTVRRGRRWPALGRKYERPAHRGATSGGAPTARDAWDALDRGDDPTTWLRNPERSRQNETDTSS